MVAIRAAVEHTVATLGPEMIPLVQELVPSLVAVQGLQMTRGLLEPTMITSPAERQVRAVFALPSDLV